MEGSSPTRTDKINAVIKKHFNKYFKEQYITTNMNEWSALRRSMKKLIQVEVDETLELNKKRLLSKFYIHLGEQAIIDDVCRNDEELEEAINKFLSPVEDKKPLVVNDCNSCVYRLESPNFGVCSECDPENDYINFKKQP